RTASAATGQHQASRPAEPPHMGVASGENAIRARIARIVLDRDEQFRHRLMETPAVEMRGAYYKERRAAAGTRTEAQRGLDMLDRNVGFARPLPEDAAEVPAAGVVRVERQGTVDQRHHSVDVLAEIRQR